MRSCAWAHSRHGTSRTRAAAFTAEAWRIRSTFTASSFERRVDPRFESGWRSVSDGFVDEGWKDTVLVMPGERVRVLVRFDDFTGVYLVHCHNLELSDMGMARNFEVVG